jgi:hypothetical protein
LDSSDVDAALDSLDELDELDAFCVARAFALVSTGSALLVALVALVALAVLVVELLVGGRLRCACASFEVLKSAAATSNAGIHRLLGEVVSSVVADTFATVSARAHHLRIFEHG